MFKIQTLNKIASAGLDKLPHDNYETASEINNPDAIMVRSAKLHEMEFPESLKSIARAGAGVNNIPVDKCSEKGIVVFNTPGANANGVKEIVLAGMLLASRGIVEGIGYVNTLKGKGEEVSKIVEKNKKNYAGNEIKGKKLGLIGLGAIGSLVANSAIALGMEVEGYDPFISVDAAWSLSSEVKKARGLEDLISSSDYLSLHLPVNDKTKGFLNSDKFALMKNGVKIMNFARGGLVNDKDLIAALKEGKVSKYVTDFITDELIGVENVIGIPHLGASTAESEENCSVMAADQLKDFLENGNILNSVNFPNCTLDRCGDSRIAIINKNIPNMVGQITSVLADSGINIIEMLNKSKGDFAYNILDIEGDVSGEPIEKLSVIEGVIKVRLI
ncbi:MAG: phosphoglycerate dehydrogenase [Fibrobacterota bacterium]